MKKRDRVLRLLAVSNCLLRGYEIQGIIGSWWGVYHILYQLEDEGLVESVRYDPDGRYGYRIKGKAVTR